MELIHFIWQWRVFLTKSHLCKMNRSIWVEYPDRTDVRKNVSILKSDNKKVSKDYNQSSTFFYLLIIPRMCVFGVFALFKAYF